jgi:peroxiredoxin
MAAAVGNAAGVSSAKLPPLDPEEVRIKERIKGQPNVIKVGDIIPNTWLARCVEQKKREHFQAHEKFSKGTTVLVIVPEAHSPTCDDQLPQYAKYAIAIKALGVETLAVMAHNSADVLRSWMIKHMPDHESKPMILDVADVYGNFIIAAGLGYDFTGERAIGLGARRCTLILEPDEKTGKPKVVHMILEPDATPNQCVATSALKVREWLQARQKEQVAIKGTPATGVVAASLT